MKLYLQLRHIQFSRLIFPTLFFVRFAVPIFLFGSIPARVHDNLDSEAVYSIVIGRFWASGFDSSVFNVFLGGSLDWTYFSRALHPINVFYSVLDANSAYILTEMVVVLIAYLSMNHFLKKFGTSGADRRILSCLFAFGISYTSYGLGLATAPLVVALSLGKQKRPSAGAILLAIFCGMNASFPLHAMFLPVACLVIVFMLRGDVNWLRLFIIQIFYFSTSAFAATGLFLFLFSDIISQRNAWSFPVEANPIADIWRISLDSIKTLSPFYHATLTPAHYAPFFLIIAAIASSRSRAALLLIIATVLAVSTLDVLFPVASRVLPKPIGTIQYERIGQFLPFIIIVLSALVLKDRKGLVGVVASLTIRLSAVVSIAAFIQGSLHLEPKNLVGALPQEARTNLNDALESEKVSEIIATSAHALRRLDLQAFAKTAPTYQKHFRVEDMQCLKKIVKDRRVLSFGLDPMIAPANGIAASDGYHNLYPLSYKQAFRPLIAPKLKRSERLSRYFDNWGNRVYTFSERVPDILPDFSKGPRIGATMVIATRVIRSSNLIERRHDCSETLFLYEIAF